MSAKGDAAGMTLEHYQTARADAYGVALAIVLTHSGETDPLPRGRRLRLPYARPHDSTNRNGGKYEQLLECCRSLPPVPTAVAHPCEEIAPRGGHRRRCQRADCAYPRP